MLVENINFNLFGMSLSALAMLGVLAKNLHRECAGAPVQLHALGKLLRQLFLSPSLLRPGN